MAFTLVAAGVAVALDGGRGLAMGTRSLANIQFDVQELVMIERKSLGEFEPHDLNHTASCKSDSGLEGIVRSYRSQ